MKNKKLLSIFYALSIIFLIIISCSKDKPSKDFEFDISKISRDSLPDSLVIYIKSLYDRHPNKVDSNYLKSMMGEDKYFHLLTSYSKVEMYRLFREDSNYSDYLYYLKSNNKRISTVNKSDIQEIVNVIKDTNSYDWFTVIPDPCEYIPDVAVQFIGQYDTLAVLVTYDQPKLYFVDNQKMIGFQYLKDTSRIFDIVGKYFPDDFSIQTTIKNRKETREYYRKVSVLERKLNNNYKIMDKIITLSENKAYMGISKLIILDSIPNDLKWPLHRRINNTWHERENKLIPYLKEQKHFKNGLVELKYTILSSGKINNVQVNKNTYNVKVQNIIIEDLKNIELSNIKLYADIKPYLPIKIKQTWIIDTFQE